MALFGFMSAAERRDDFAKRLIKRMAEQGWSHPMGYNPDAFAVDFGGSAGVIGLGSLYATWSRYPKQQQTAALDEVTAFVFDQGPPPPFEEARLMLMPLVRPRMLAEAEELGAQDAPAGVCRAWSPLTEHLAVHVAIDRPSSTTIVDSPLLADWGITFDAALEMALSNLQAYAWPPLLRQEGGFFAADDRDYYDLSRLLAPDMFAGLGFRGAPIAVAPIRDRLLVADSDDADALEAMAKKARWLMDEGTHPVSIAPLLLHDGAWSTYRPAAGASAFATASAEQLLMDYGMQDGLLLDRIKRDGRSERIADANLLPVEDGVVTLALWLEPTCLLPRLDQILLQTPSGTLVRRWDDIQAVCALPFEPGTVLPYLVASRWPTEAEMTQIEAAPEPEWARGRAVSVTDGRITLFG